MIEHQDRLYERKSELKTLLKALAASGSPVASSGGSSAIENWSEPFEWDSRADDVRFNIFGISNYRANQKEVSDVLHFLIENVIYFICGFLYSRLQKFIVMFNLLFPWMAWTDY